MPRAVSHAAQCLGTPTVGYHTWYIVFFFFVNLFIYLFLFLAVLGLHCRARAFSSCGERGLLLVAVCGLLNAVASLVEHRL